MYKSERTTLHCRKRGLDVVTWAIINFGYGLTEFYFPNNAKPFSLAAILDII
jgi:hypothetical protein